MPAWEKVEVPPGGSFIGWGRKAGQHVTGKVIDYDAQGGTDFNGKTCPLLEVELTEKAASFNKALERSDHPPGDVVTLTCGLYELKRAIQAAEPAPGDMLKIVFDGEEEIEGGRAVKRFSLQIARGGAKRDKPNVRVVKSLDDAATATAEAVNDGDDEPPF